MRLLSVAASGAMTWLTTATVLQKLRDFDNREAWESFADRFRQPVVSFARSMGLPPVDAEDVAQETLLAFAEAYRKGNYDPSKGRLSRFLFGIAYRQSLRARRQREQQGGLTVRLPSGGSGVWAEIPDEETASGIWDTEWERCALERCLQQARSEFEPETFRAFELTVREEMTPAETARRLGIPVKSVYNAKHRVLKRIRELREAFESHE
ncbi:MAG: sigma-70 family RNA polymerase sigma factor [Phycisphaerae bacterium]|nr:sigma-70 family RNA polymerase sigma factor [Phycisphaerae bacterium]MDW8262404.1 sigma-70 family RNA polymerase sigma factor [Phycisphaerales bacterium]